MTNAPPLRSCLKTGFSDNSTGKSMSKGDPPDWVGRQIIAAYEEHANLINSLRKKLDDSKIRESSLLRRLEMNESYDTSSMINTGGGMRANRGSATQSKINSFDMDELPMDEMAHTVLNERNMRQQSLIEVNKKIEHLQKEAEHRVYSERMKSVDKSKEYENKLEAKDREIEEQRKIAQRHQLEKTEFIKQQTEQTKNMIDNKPSIVSPEKMDDNDRSIELLISKPSVSLEKLSKAFDVMISKQVDRSNSENEDMPKLRSEEREFLDKIGYAFHASQKKHRSLNRSLQFENDQLYDRMEKQNIQSKKEQKILQDRLKQVEVALRKTKAAKKRQDDDESKVVTQLQEELAASEIEHENLAYRLRMFENKEMDMTELEETISAMERECTELMEEKKTIEDEHMTVVSAIRRVMNDTIEDKDQIIEQLNEKNYLLNMQVTNLTNARESQTIGMTPLTG